MAKPQFSKADNFLRHLTEDQITSFKQRVYVAKGVWLKSTTCDELYAELVEHGLIAVTPKEPRTGEKKNVAEDKQDKEAGSDMDAE